jgi:hypothetical protein
MAAWRCANMKSYGATMYGRWCVPGFAQAAVEPLPMDDEGVNRSSHRRRGASPASKQHRFAGHHPADGPGHPSAIVGAGRAAGRHTRRCQPCPWRARAHPNPDRSGRRGSSGPPPAASYNASSAAAVTNAADDPTASRPSGRA